MFEQIVIGDEKWILYNNVKSRNLERQNVAWLTLPKTSFNRKKMMLSIWQDDWKGFLYYKLLLI